MPINPTIHYNATYAIVQELFCMEIWFLLRRSTLLVNHFSFYVISPNHNAGHNYICTTHTHMYVPTLVQVKLKKQDIREKIGIS